MRLNLSSSVTVVLSGCVVLLAQGCYYGQARVVHRQAGGGILALTGNPEEAIDDANRQMSRHCGGEFHVTEERRVLPCQGKDLEKEELQIAYACRLQASPPSSDEP